MRITLHTDYAFRMLMLLAAEPERSHTVEEVATRFGISRNHLMKVAQTLAQAGFIESIRGRSGGVRLRRNPADINLGAVIRTTEDGFNLVECFDDKLNSCSISHACGLRGPMEEALDAFLGVLDRYTLSDLVNKPGRLRRMLDLLVVA